MRFQIKLHPSMVVYAHTRPDRPPTEWEPLEAHAKAVAALAELFCEGFAPGFGHALGWLHDAGKYQPAFQQYLQKDNEAYDETRPDGVPHSIVGAWLAAKSSTAHVGQLLAWPIAAHHGALRDKPGLSASLQTANRLLEDAVRGGMPIEMLNGMLPQEAPKWAHGWEAFAFGTRMLFSALVDADMLATEAWDKGREREKAAVSLNLLAERLEEYLRQKRCQSDNIEGRAAVLARMRAEVSDACYASAEMTPGAFRLTVPTGGGKTLSGLRFALRHALLHGLKRIIVVIPYTSILEQTAHTYRTIFDEIATDAVIEHHSSLDPEGESQQHRQACENWDAPIIITTSVQFFETLYANHKRPCRKLHRIANSVVLLDEVQTFPLGMLDPIQLALKNLSVHFRTSVVSMTATQPLLREEGRDREIVPQPKRLYEVMRCRFQLEWLGSPGAAVDWPTLASAALQHERVLVIVHARRDAEEMAHRLGAECIHLSARMCAAHRLDVLERVKATLRGGGPCRVVATQLVEAGVDIDFPVVFRAFAGLETLAQAAGRCNREYAPIPGRFIVFRAPTEPPAGSLRAGLKTAQRFYQDGRIDLHNPDIFALYTKEVLQSQETDESQVLTSERDQDFPESAIRFKMIGQSGAAVIVPYGEGWERAQALRQIGPSRDGLRGIQRYTVTLYEQEFRRLRREGFLEPLFDSGESEPASFQETLWVIPGNVQPSPYSERFGLSWQAVEAEPSTLIA
jgi:CRISPR-associated endonuclease/helicase Cas3